LSFKSVGVFRPTSERAELAPIKESERVLDFSFFFAVSFELNTLSDWKYSQKSI